MECKLLKLCPKKLILPDKTQSLIVGHNWKVWCLKRPLFLLCQQAQKPTKVQQSERVLANPETWVSAPPSWNGVPYLTIGKPDKRSTQSAQQGGDMLVPRRQRYVVVLDTRKNLQFCNWWIHLRIHIPEKRTCDGNPILFCKPLSPEHMQNHHRTGPLASHQDLSMSTLLVNYVEMSHIGHVSHGKKKLLGPTFHWILVA